MLLSPNAFVMIDFTSFTNPKRKSSSDERDSGTSSHSPSSPVEAPAQRHNRPMSLAPAAYSKRKLTSFKRSTSVMLGLDDRVNSQNRRSTSKSSDADTRHEGSSQQSSGSDPLADSRGHLSPATSASGSVGHVFREPYSHSSDGHSLDSELANVEELRELYRKSQARESNFAKRNGKKLHRYPTHDVPYPRSFDREVIDLDVWCMIWGHQLVGEVALRGGKGYPDKILDLGCGTGSWILNASMKWKTTHFVGLDIVPLHPDLEDIDPDLAARITWVQANFLERLPFPDQEFDFVYARRIARGVPEDKWDYILEEILRVLKPGGSVQITEEDLYFPGIQHMTAIVRNIAPELAPTITSPRSPSPFTPPTAVQSLPAFDEVVLSDDITRTSDGHLVTDDNHVHFFSQHNPPVDPRDHSLLEHIYNEMHAARFINLTPTSILSNTLPLYFAGLRLHPPLLSMFPMQERGPDASLATPRSLALSLSNSSNLKSHNAQMRSNQEFYIEQETIIQRADRLDFALTHPQPDRLRPFLNVPQLISGKSLYARADMERYNAYGPRSIFPPSEFQRHHFEGVDPTLMRSAAAQKAYSRTPGIKESADRLSVDSIRYDLRTLNLQLALRVQEVLSCSEAMWDFVVEFQTAHVSAEQPPAEAQGVRGKTSRQNSDMGLPTAHRGSVLDPMEIMIMQLTRQQFDFLLRRFKFDVQDYMDLTDVLENRLHWGPVSLCRTDERKEFDVLCEAWEQYQAELQAGAVRRPSARASTASNLPSERSHEARSYGDDGLGTSRPHARTSLNTARQDGHSAPPHESESATAAHKLASARRSAPSPNAVPVHERLSRTIRTFVAYKA